MKNSNKDTRRKGNFPFYKKGTSLGVLAGIGMAFVAILNSGSDTIAASFIKYTVLLPFLFLGLYQLKNTFIEGNFFKEGILFGSYTAFIAAVAFIIVNVVAVTSGARISEKFSYEAKSLADIIGFQGINFFEIIGLGTILTFICLQFLKFTGENTTNQRTITE